MGSRDVRPHTGRDFGHNGPGTLRRAPRNARGARCPKPCWRMGCGCPELAGLDARINSPSRSDDADATAAPVNGRSSTRLGTRPDKPEAGERDSHRSGVHRSSRQSRLPPALWLLHRCGRAFCSPAIRTRLSILLEPLNAQGVPPHGLIARTHSLVPAVSLAPTHSAPSVPHTLWHRPPTAPTT